jgi:hypothetical protein
VSGGSTITQNTSFDVTTSKLVLYVLVVIGTEKENWEQMERERKWEKLKVNIPPDRLDDLRGPIVTELFR